jgi:hypothetical protein
MPRCSRSYYENNWDLTGFVPLEAGKHFGLFRTCGVTRDDITRRLRTGQLQVTPGRVGSISSARLPAGPRNPHRPVRLRDDDSGEGLFAPAENSEASVQEVVAKDSRVIRHLFVVQVDPALRDCATGLPQA